MRRKMAVLATVALIVLTVAAPALAAGGDQRNGPNGPIGPLDKPIFALVGIITGVDSGTITAQVYHGNRLAKPYIGQELTVQLTSVTAYRRWTPDGCVPAALDDVQVGDTVSILGLVMDGDFIAMRVTIDVPLACCRL